jgi:hypothetical protein
MTEIIKKIILFVFGLCVAAGDAARKRIGGATVRVQGDGLRRRKSATRLGASEEAKARRRYGLIASRFVAPAYVLAVAALLLIPGVFSYAKEIGSDAGEKPGEYQAWLLGVPVPETIAGENPEAVIRSMEIAVDRADSAEVPLITGKSKLHVPAKEHAVKLTGDLDTNEGRMWRYLLDQGFTPEQAAGIIGNALKENGTLNPEKTGGSGAFGIFQYTGGRKARVQSLANGYTLEGQLDYMMIELNGGYAALNEALRNAETIEEAVILFQDEYERPGVAATDARLRKAYETYARYIGTPGSV